LHGGELPYLGEGTKEAMMQADYTSLIGPIKNKRTFEEVADRLKELIFDGVFKPGQQLPSETGLAHMFQVGRQSVREALRVLEISGFISTRPGIKGGAVIENTAQSRLSSLFLDTMKLNKASLHDCIAVRRALEISILDFVIKNADHSDIDELKASIERAREILDSDSPAFHENIHFHRLLAKASKNFVFSIVMESLITVYIEFKSKATDVTLSQSRTIMETHEKILSAIVERNREKAVKLLENDLDLGGEILLRSLISRNLVRDPAASAEETPERKSEGGDKSTQPSRRTRRPDRAR
jgi:GntR family transcriptional regulator, transcriptional repressor for pyruvate dehydrogenase complex